ncbi:hypothetical protein WOLCODRAFT_167872 [Wolfiporia cocos MD-104 SS10]|uniref:Fungal-type protein kinase domain-containing protein n=1 Tax=Wolfiporia cocos (strain MD-104) TaxID=742152 RepID=A0A2H3JAM3_WOLCO|nr:hypothetical protein WOLCODRAFT_167872 [Wolfiporia cocos MD-104 SS10]
MSKTFPDIVGLLSGTSLDQEAPWAQIGLVVEVKGANHLDPMDSESQRASADLVRIVESALNLLSAHGALYAYVLHVLGCSARIYRFDHASAIVSRRFDYIDAHEFILKFFYRLLHPSYSSDIALNGQDDFSCVVSENFVKGLGIPGLIAEDLYRNRVLTLPSVGRQYLTLRPVHFSPRLFSRATLVREGLEVFWCPLPEDRRLTQGNSDNTGRSSRRKGKGPASDNTWSLTPDGQARVDDADGSSLAIKNSGTSGVPAKRARRGGSVHASADPPQASSSSACDGLSHGFQVRHVIIKEQHRQTERVNEAVHYDKIKANLKKRKIPRYGLADMLYGEDLGETFSVHVTVSATVSDPTNGPRNERSHMRIVLDIVGEPLTKVTSTKQLVQAIRDAIIGHLLAYLSGVLHRDVSIGNVMLVRNRVAEFLGFICDLDYGSPIDSSKVRWKGIHGTPFHGVTLRGTPLSKKERDRLNELEDELKERTGTMEFMAMELIDAEPSDDVFHQVYHDLESFFWLLVWVVLRHTKHDHPEGEGAFGFIFGAITPRQVKERKESLFNKDIFAVKGNAPLSRLLLRLQSMVSEAYVWTGPEFKHVQQIPVPLTYDAILEAFDEALNMEGWPEDNAAIPFKTSYSKTDGRVDIKISSGVIGTSSVHKMDEAGPAPSSGGGNAPSSQHASQGSQDAETTSNLPKHSTRRGAKARSSRRQANGRGIKRKQPIWTRSIARQTGVSAETSSIAAGLPTTEPGSTAAGSRSAEQLRKRCRAKDWSELMPPRDMHDRKAKRAWRG